MSNQWFRLYAEIIDHELVGLLSFEDQRHYVWLLAMKCAGMLDKDYPSEKVREAAIARKLGLQGEALCNAKIRISEVGLIDDDWQPRNWDKRQFRTDTDPTNAERQRRHRQKKAQEKQEDTDSNGGVTRYGNETITHQSTDTDTEEDTHPTDESAKTRGVSARSPCPYNEILSLWREILPELPAPHSPEHWTAARKAQIRARWNDQLPDLGAWRECFELVRRSPFLMGQTARPFRCRLFWLTKPENLLKLYEGNYDG